MLFYSLVGDLLAHNYRHGLIARLPENLLVTVLAVSNVLWLGSARRRSGQNLV